MRGIGGGGEVASARTALERVALVHKRANARAWARADASGSLRAVYLTAFHLPCLKRFPRAPLVKGAGVLDGRTVGHLKAIIGKCSDHQSDEPIDVAVKRFLGAVIQHWPSLIDLPGLGFLDKYPSLEAIARHQEKLYLGLATIRLSEWGRKVPAQVSA